MLELYSLSGCPYCAKLERKLEALALEYERHAVSAFRFRRTEVKEVSGRSGVPGLVDHRHDVTGLAESDAIVAYLERAYG